MLVLEPESNQYSTHTSVTPSLSVTETFTMKLSPVLAASGELSTIIGAPLSTIENECPVDMLLLSLVSFAQIR